MKQLLQRGLAIAGTMAMLAAPLASHAAITNSFSVGDLIKGSGSTVYYFAPDGRRLVFVNDKTYFTWYANFDSVKTISDRALSAIPLGRVNVTYRPGVKMVKITTDPKVYAVDQNGVLRWVKTQELAESIFGLSWKSLIDDVPDPFFINYRIGNPIETSAEYIAANIRTGTTNITQDKQMDDTAATLTISSVDAGFVPTSITIKSGTTVTWTNRDTAVHSVTGAAFDSGDIAANHDYVHRFTTTGSFEYHDTINPGNVATINVVP